MQKIAILLLTILLFSEEKINAQETLKELTEYKTDRKSLHFVADSDEYLLVDNGEYNLDVLTVNDEGQLYKYFESDLPYCVEGKTIRTDISDTHILFYYGDHIIFQNFHTGETRRVDNLPWPSIYQDPIAFFSGSEYYIINTNAFYIFSLVNDSLLGQYESLYLHGNLVINGEEVNNEYYSVIDHLNTGVKIKFDLSHRQFYKTNFTGLIYQHQPYEITSELSDKHVLYFINQDGTIDTIKHKFPQFSFVDKLKSSSSILMVKQTMDQMNWNQLNVFYKYDLNKDSLLYLDTLKVDDSNNGIFITDSLYLYTTIRDQHIYNIYTHEITDLGIPQENWLLDQIQSKLVFVNHDNATYVYDYKLNELTRLTHKDSMTYRYFNRVLKDNKAYYCNLEQLTFPLYEVSDSIYAHNQNIASTANENGIRTSLLKKSNNYIYTFDDQDIVVLDTTQVDGYRKMRVIEHTQDLGCLSVEWYEYNDVLYGFIPIYKEEKRYYDLVSINLQNFEVTNLTEELGLPIIEDDLFYYNISIRGDKGILFWNKYLIDINTKEKVDISAYVDNFRLYSVLKFDQKILLTDGENQIAFEYPLFNYLEKEECELQKFIGDKYYICKAALSSNNFTVSDGEKEVIVGDAKDYYFVGSRNYVKLQNGFCLANYNTQKARIYVVSEEVNGALKAEKVYEKTFNKIWSISEKHFDNYICLYVEEDNEKLLILYNVHTKEIKEIPEVDPFNILELLEDQIIFSNYSLRRIEKINFDGELLKSIDYPKGLNYVFPNQEVNLGQKGLFILNTYLYDGSSRIVFDSETFSYLFNTECEFEFVYWNNHDNVVYKDSAYYFNIDIGEKGRQIYRLHNPYDNGISTTTDGKISTFGLYPNPVTSAFEIKTPEPCAIHSLKVYDYLGRSHPVLHLPCETTIQVDHLEQGAYIIELIEGTSRKVARFVKM
ncbi:MAG TPA: T9SS type A sorting domain-containing protein [Saprospiraceae bacterium]|nr:T9SS type A sorting domain-containing protein [Saprospiraceae bacterium]